MCRAVRRVRAAECRRSVLQLGRRSRLVVVAVASRRGLPHRISRYGRAHSAPDDALYGCRLRRHIVRLPPPADVDPAGHTSDEFSCERPCDVAAQANRVSLDARRRELLHAVAEAARGARVPSCRAVQQPQPRRGEDPELSVRAAEFDRRPRIHAAVDDRGRCGNVGDRDVDIRPRPATEFHDVLSRLRRCLGALSQQGQVVLRLVQGLYPRPLQPRLPDMPRRLLALRRGHGRPRSMAYPRVVRI